MEYRIKQIAKYFLIAMPVVFLAAACNKQVTTFEDCVKINGMIKTLPAQCEYKGQVFIEKTQSPGLRQTKSADEMANWKTYKNTKFGFEFKYPAGTNLERSIDAKTSGPATEEYVNFVGTFMQIDYSNAFGNCSALLSDSAIRNCLISTKGLTTKDLANDILTPVTIGAEHAVRLEVTLVPPPKAGWDIAPVGYIYYVSHGAANLQISTGDSLANRNMAEKILFTFKFTNAATSDWKIYKNTDFGFEVTLTDAWKGYKVELQPISSNIGSATLVFKVPTKSKNYGDGLGYAEPMIISVLNMKYWNKLQSEDGPKPEFLGKNSTYVFAYSFWQDPPTDLINVNLDLNKVVSSFKFTK